MTGRGVTPTHMCAGLVMVAAGREDAEGSEAAEAGSPRSAPSGPPGGSGYLSAMLTYIDSGALRHADGLLCLGPDSTPQAA